MRVKVLPSDFQVEETVVPPPPDIRGEYQIYKLSKRNVSAFDAIDAISRALQVSRDDIGLAGLKDLRSQSTQLVSVRFSRGSKSVSGPIDLGRGLNLEPVHRAARPIRPEDNLRNRFAITVRDLSAAEAEAALAEAALVRSEGFPNYFDDQRFGGASPARGFVAEAWSKGELDRALELMAARPSPKDPRRDRLEKKRIGERLAAARTPEARAQAWRDLAGEAQGEAAPVVRALARDPADLVGAFRALDGRFRALLVAQYQSFLWNEAAVREVRAALPPAATFDVMYRCGTFAFWRGAGAPFQGHQIAFPTFDVPEGIGVVAKPGARPLALVPEALEAAPPAPDERFPGRHKVMLNIDLPRGAYATVVVKRIFYAKNARRSETV